MWESVFGWVAVLNGLAAAVLWYRASRVRVDPGWASDPIKEPGDPVASQAGWTMGLLKAAKDSADLNARAAAVTAAAVVMQALSLGFHQLGR